MFWTPSSLLSSSPPKFARHRCFGVFRCSLSLHCVLITRAIQVSCDQMENDPSLPDRTNLTVDNICFLLSLFLDATYLLFEGKVYQQIHGTATGSPVSVAVAKHGGHWTEGTINLPHTWFWKRYVDNTCTVLPLELVDSFHSHLNNTNPNTPVQCLGVTVDRQLNWKDHVEGVRRSVYVAWPSCIGWRRLSDSAQEAPVPNIDPIYHTKTIVRLLGQNVA